MACSRTVADFSGGLLSFRCAETGFPAFSNLSGSVFLDGKEYFL